MAEAARRRRKCGVRKEGSVRKKLVGLAWVEAKERTRNIPVHYNYRIIPMLAQISLGGTKRNPEIRLIRGYRSVRIATTGI